MAKTLFADGNTGKVCIYTGSSDVVDNPYIDLTRVFFHSDLQYLQAFQIFEQTIHRDAWTTSSYQTQLADYTIVSGDYFTNYVLLIFIDQQMYMGGAKTVLQPYDSRIVIRRVTIKIGTDGVIATIQEDAGLNAPLPAQDINVKVIALKII